MPAGGRAISGLAPGSHRVEVRAVDSGGLASAVWSGSVRVAPRPSPTPVHRHYRETASGLDPEMGWVLAAVLRNVAIQVCSTVLVTSFAEERCFSGL